MLVRVDRARHGPDRRWLPALRPTTGLAVAGLVIAVLAFSRGWGSGRMTLDGEGVELHLRLALDQWLSGGRVSYWLPQMWSGTPVWNLAPSLSTVELVPLAVVVGPDLALRLATLAAQVVGGWGAFVLARSLWGRWAPAAVAALVYALHPIFVSHGTLFGHETSAWVFAATPWLAWTFRSALREHRPGRAAVAGLVAAFAVLHQAEHAYSLVALCGLLLAVEAARARRLGGWPTTRKVFAHAGVAVAVALGGIAYWLVPFVANQHEFVLTPPAAARSDVLNSPLGRRPGTWLVRSPGLHGAVSFGHLVRDLPKGTGLAKGAFYLGTVCVVLTVATILLLLRDGSDGTLAAILLASGVSLWMSSGGVSLASTASGSLGALLGLALVAGLAGLLVWTFLRRLGLPRAASAVTAGAFAVAVPYLTPFLLLQRVVPFVAHLRFPRWYPLAMLGLSLATAYPLVRLRAWLEGRVPQRAARVDRIACLVVVAAFLVDLAPYRSYYRLRPPDGTDAYRRVSAVLDEVGAEPRVAVANVSDPRPAAELVRRGHLLATGWPHPMASAQVWRLTVEPFVTPRSYREAALGLSSTAYLATDTLDAAGQRVVGVSLVRNPGALPLVRAYDSAVVVEDERVTPEMAVALAQRNVATITGGRGVAQTLRGLPVQVASGDACDGSGGRPRSAPSSVELADELAMACALHTWVGVYTGLETLPVPGRGAVFGVPVDGLRGIRVWLDRPAPATELVVRALAPDGTLGDEVARAVGASGGGDDMATFSFDPLSGAAGKRYAFVLECPGCEPGNVPRMLVTDAERGPGDLLSGGQVDRAQAVAFGLVYGDMPAAPPSQTQLRTVETGRGSWRIETQGERDSVVVLAESKFRGWKVTVDGHAARLLEADGAFLGVRVPAGEHKVTFRYTRPASADVGLAITVLTLLVVIAGALRPTLQRAGSTARTAMSVKQVREPPGRITETPETLSVPRLSTSSPPWRSRWTRPAGRSSTSPPPRSTRT